MQSLEELKAAFKKSYQETQVREAAYKVNPGLAKSPEAKRYYRRNGLIIFILGLALTVANYVGYQSTGRFLAVILAANIVFIGAGLWMIVTGRNPFRLG